MATISAEKNLEMLRKNANGTYTKYNPKTKASNVILNNKKTVESQFDDITNTVGNKNSLRTSNKSNLVNAINEVFQCGNNVKSNTVDALLRLDDSLQLSKKSSWVDIIKKISNIKTGYGVNDKIDALNLKYDNGFKGTTMLYKHDEIYGGYELLEVDSNGYFYASTYNGGLTKTSSDGNQIWKINLDHPNDLAVDSKGNIYTVHNHNSNSDYKNLRKISSDGKEIWRKSIGYRDLDHMILDNNKEYIYVGTDITIYKIDLDGNEILEYEESTDIGMLIDKKNNMYVGTNNATGRMIKLDSNGKRLWEFELEETYDEYQCFTINLDSNVYIGGPDNTLIKLSPEGKEIWRKKLASSDICYVITDDKGYVYYYNYNYIGKINSDGKEIWNFEKFKKIESKNSIVSNIKLGIFYLDKIGECDNGHYHGVYEIKKINQIQPNYTVLK